MEYIIDVNYKGEPDLSRVREVEAKIIDGVSLTKDEVSLILDYIIYSTRKIVGENVVNSCDLCQMLICNYLDEVGVKNNPNMTIDAITSDIVGHSFTVASFNTVDGVKNYIVDPSYIQFFKKEDCDIGKYFIYKDIVLMKPALGFFIADSDKIIVKDFLDSGYMEMNSRNAEIYGNSFYWTKTGIPSGSRLSKIDGDIFIKSFLKGNVKLSEYDNLKIELLNHTGKSK